VDQNEEKGVLVRCSPWLSGGGSKSSNDGDFLATVCGRHAKGGEGMGVPCMGPVGEKKGWVAR
jgi:hypothetical protein